MVDFMSSQDFERSLCFSLYPQNRSSLLLQVSKFQICFHSVAYVHGHFCTVLYWDLDLGWKALGVPSLTLQDWQGRLGSFLGLAGYISFGLVFAVRTGKPH
jgi:hypothetical protein